MTDDTEDLATRLAELDAQAESQTTLSRVRFRDALVSAYRAGRLVVDEGWQPIETAPRDGRVVLGYWAEDRVETIQFQFRSFVYSADGDGWTDRGPTHWRPLPAPPKGEDE